MSIDTAEREQGLRGVRAMRRALMAQRGHLFPWVPVGMALGVGLYFSMAVEPAVFVSVCLAILACMMVFAARKCEVDVGVSLWAIALIAFGFSIAGARAHWVAGPVIQFRYYGPIEGRIVAIDRSASDAQRLTLADVNLDNVAPENTPKHVRVSLHGDQPAIDLRPGMVIGTTGHLSAPSGPVEPGGFDFQRHAWFQELGAVGYTRSPVVELLATIGGGGVYGARLALSAAIQARMPQDVAGFAAAVTTGDRAAISQETIRDLRISNLAHLLAISGLHMGLLAGFVFAAVRFLVALMPYVRLRINGKKVAASVALVASAGYLVMSGGSVSTERAFVMTAVMLCAVLLDRRAISLRAVAVAAIVVLVLRPEALLGPGFQMSFAATTALVAVFGWLRDGEVPLGPRWLRPVAAVVISSFVAGLATAPFAAMHFNQIAHYGLAANVLAVPVMGLVVVPSAVLALMLSPFGLEQVGLWPMGVGLRWILSVAHFFSDMDGARGTIASGGPWVLPIISIGSLWLFLWQGLSRWAGVAVVVAGCILWGQAQRPDILIADTGGLVGLMTPQGRALSKAKGQGFVAKNWLENDGSAHDQAAAASLWPDQAPGVRMVDMAGRGRLIHVHGKRGLASFQGCDADDIVVFSTEYSGDLPCERLDVTVLKTTGAVAIRLDGAERKLIAAREIAGRRIWNDFSK